DDSRRALHERLEDEGGDLLVAAGDDRLRREGSRLEAVPRAGRPAIHVRGRDAQDVEEQRVEELVEEIHPADAHRADRVAVVRVAEGDELRLLRLAAQPPVLEGDLERHLDGGRSGIRVEDLVEDRLSIESGRALDELRGQLDGGRRGEAEQRGMPDVLELQLDGAVDLRLAVP